MRKRQSSTLRQVSVATFALLAACTAAAGQARGQTVDTAALSRSVSTIAKQVAPGVLGVAIKDVTSGERWSFNGSRRFPMQSVFKAPLGAALLTAVDRNELALDSLITLRPSDLSPPYSPIGAAFPARTAYRIEELLVAAAGSSDNTAADVLMQLIGGPVSITRWLTSKGVSGLRIDRYEREFQVQLAGMPSFRPEWARESAFLSALNAVPVATRRRATAAYLNDARDTSTPLGAVRFLEQLQAGALLSASSTARLLHIMTETKTGALRIKAALPAGATLAHKTGSARPDLGVTPAVNDIGIITLPNGRQLLLAIFLKGATLPYQQAESIHADVTRAVMTHLR